MHLRSTATLATIAALAGCAGDAPEFPDPDVEVVALDVSSVIGSIDSGGPESFGQVSGVAVDAAGRVLVSDAQSGTIKVFDVSGAFLYEAGREGQGPDEFGSPCCVTVAPDGRVWVRDRLNARYGVWEFGDSTARGVATVRMAHGDPRRSSPISFRDSLVGDLGLFTDDDGRRRLGRHWLALDGSVVEVEAFDPATPEDLGGESVSARGGAVTYFLYPPQGPEDLLDFGPRGSAVRGVTSSYDVELATAVGTTRVGRPVAEGPTLSEREVGIASSRLEQLAARIDGAVSDLPFGVPDRKPPLADAYFAQNGNLWVELSVPDGAPRVADVWSPSGELLERVTWPGDVELSSRSWIGDDVVVGQRRDELGVDYVVVMVRPR